MLIKPGKTHQKRLISVLRERDVENEKYARVQQAFTYGVKLKNGQPESKELYEHVKKVVAVRE